MSSIPNGFKVEACYYDRSEQVRAFSSLVEAQGDLAIHNSGVSDKRDKCGPIFWRLSVFGAKNFNGEWVGVLTRASRTGCLKVLAEIIDAARFA